MATVSPHYLTGRNKKMTDMQHQLTPEQEAAKDALHQADMALYDYVNAHEHLATMRAKLNLARFKCQHVWMGDVADADPTDIVCRYCALSKRDFDPSIL